MKDEIDLDQAAKGALNWCGPSSLDSEENGHMDLPANFGVVYGYAPYAEDLRDVSNYASLLERVKAAAGDNADRDVQEGRVNHWTYRFFDIIIVRVYEPGYEPGRWDNVDEHPKDVEDVRYTAAFLEAVECGLELRRRPILDDDDYNQREQEQWNEAIKEAIFSASRSYPDDTEFDRDAIENLMGEMIADEYGMGFYEIISPDGCTADDVRPDVIREWYGKARDELQARRVAQFWGDPIYLHRV